MPNIKLTKRELDHIRTYYEYELEEAHQYINQLKSIIRKLDNAKAPTVIKPVLATDKIAKPAKKRGRPPKAKAEIPVKAEEPKPKVKRGRPRKVKIEPAKAKNANPTGKKRGRPANPKAVIPAKVLPEIPSVVPAEKVAANAVQEKPTVLMAPKPKRKRTANYRRRGVYLTNLSKPLPKMPKDDESEPEVSTDTQQE